jgi:hypothetical protein
VGPRAGLGDVEKRKFLVLTGLELWPLGLSARSQSLYRLRFPGCVHNCINLTRNMELKICNFARTFVWVCNFVPDSKGRT